MEETLRSEMNAMPDKRHSAKRIAIFSVVIAIILIIAVLAALYLFNYLKPLNSFVEATDKHYFHVVDNMVLAPRSAVIQMVEISQEYNPEHYEKYKKILRLPLPYYPMSSMQAIELCVWADSDEETLASWEFKTISVHDDLSIQASSRYQPSDLVE